MRIAVIGAGPAGMTAAYQLAKGGAEVEVFEAGPVVGGMSRSIKLWGQTVDLGPHRFFSSDARVNGLWLEVVGRDYRMVERITRIYYNGRFFHYPLQATNALINLGLFEAFRCGMSYLREKVSPGSSSSSNETFESWVVDRFGRRLFEIFFKTYSEKLWGISCQELDADFAAQRIKRFSLGEAIKDVFGLGAAQHKTLVRHFAYPTTGTGTVYERMAESVRNRPGCRILTGTPIKGLCRDGNRISGIVTENGETREFDHVISTMPLTHMVRAIGDMPAEVENAVNALQFRNTILVYLHVSAKDVFPDQWLYVHASNLRMGRITNFRNWVPDIVGDCPGTILALEYWCNFEDALWAEDDQTLIDRAKDEILRTGLIRGAGITDGHVVRIPRCYPIYRKGYKDHLDVVTTFLKQFSGITPIGRYGAFKYNNQDHGILMGILVAENLLGGKNNDLWAVNTDYDSYQESTAITASGLVTSE
jgi:protoporphyrinogen oxidase